MFVCICVCIYICKCMYVCIYAYTKQFINRHFSLMIYQRVLNTPVYTVEPCYLSNLLKILKEEEGEGKVGEKEMGQGAERKGRKERGRRGKRGRRRRSHSNNIYFSVIYPQEIKKQRKVSTVTHLGRPISINHHW